MADIDKLIPHIIKWETGVVRIYGESLERLFERARRNGWANDPDDRGGATQTGVTFATFKNYRRMKGKTPPSLSDLKNITYEEWRDLLFSLFWEKIHGNAIGNEDVAIMIADWYWGSGIWAIKNTQKVLGVVRDGIVGAKTLAAISNYRGGQRSLWNDLREERSSYYRRIAKGRQAKFLRGWMNRLNDLKWHG